MLRRRRVGTGGEDAEQTLQAHTRAVRKGVGGLGGACKVDRKEKSVPAVTIFWGSQ
jgi:hypothetical protein